MIESIEVNCDSSSPSNTKQEVGLEVDDADQVESDSYSVNTAKDADKDV